MASQLLPIAALLLSSAFLLMAGGLHGLLLPIRGTAEGFTTLELGFIGTGWSVGFMAGCLLMPAVVRRVGHVRTYGVMASVAAIAILLNLLIISPLAWILLRGLSGFCFAGTAMVVESWLNERATKENRGRVFSIYQMVVFGGSTTGQLLMVITPPADYFFFVIGAMLYCLAVLPTALSTAQHPQPLKTNRLALRAIYRNSPVSAVGVFMIGLVNSSFGALGAVYARQIGLPVATTAVLMAGAVLGGSLVQFPLGRLSDRMDRRKVLLGVCAGAIVISLFLIVFRPHSPELIIAILVVFGAMIYPMYGIAVAHANDFAAPDDFVKIAGGLLLLLGFGSMIGPVLAAQLMQVWLPEGLFAFAAVIHVLLALYTLFRMSRRQAPATATRESFQGVPLPKIATPESIVLDPRAAASEAAASEAASAETAAPEPGDESPVQAEPETRPPAN